MYDGGNITVWAKAITPYGCVDSVKAVIGEAAPEITANNPTVICPGESANLTANVSGCTTPAMTYTWDIGGTGSTTTVPAITTGNLTTTTTYTVTVRNAYGNTSAVSNTGTITVHDAPTIALTSGSNNQSIVNNNAITQIQYTTTNATGAEISGQPPGVSGTWSDGKYTLSGTPTITGTYKFTVITINNNGCTNATAIGTISVCRRSSKSWTTCSGITEITSEESEMCQTLTYAQAVTACAAKGAGWHLPTVSQLQCICNNKSTVPGGMTGSFNWTSEQGTSANYYKTVSVSTCNSSQAGIGAAINVKCVK
jgi:hypothetical protein